VKEMFIVTENVKPENHGKKWNEEDLRELRGFADKLQSKAEMYNSEVEIQKMADKFGRTLVAVYKQIETYRKWFWAEKN
jgi:hypothetical protein